MYAQHPGPQVHEPEVSPFLDPPSPHTVDASGLGVAGLQRPGNSRRPSGDSFTSTLYSSNASVHSALPARLSVGGAHMLASPFDDPSSPVSDVEDEFHSLRGNNRTSGVSKL